MAEILFSWIDYVLFLSMLILSTLIGIYYGFFQKQSTANDYLLGGKQMTIWPVAMSLASSTISGLTLLALPVDIYNYGICYWLGLPLFPLVLYVSYKIYLPVFYKLQITSTYEYLKIRFDNRIRLLASILFTINNILYLPIVIYAPALALSKVTGINTHYITPTLCTVCIFYTTFGGIKAVIWTDALQFFVMLGSVAIVFIMGVGSVGGITKIWNLNYQTGRLDIPFAFDLTKRDSFWTGSICNFCMFLIVAGMSQGCVQKCLSLPSFKHIKTAYVLFFFAMFSMMTFSAWSGFIMFAKYYDCDPLKSNKIKKPDELLPYYIMDVAHSIPGLPGLFVSGVFSAALSTLSASLNCLSATIYEDFISLFMPKSISQETVSKILKFLVVMVGVICTILVFVVERLGNILPLAMSFAGITNGPLLGLFSVGMLVPMVNCIGALTGGITSLIVMAWIALTSQWYKTKGIIKYPPLPAFTHGCNVTLNALNETISTTSCPKLSEPEEPFVIYKVSFYFYTLLGLIIVFIVSIAVSYFTKSDETLNKDCIAPISQRFIKSEKHPPTYYTIDKAANIAVNNTN
ncbi:sodium-coupled monocarboxylate transporter 1-like [Onthophagus taurus]|uniref:sodium-coupled monocarboxylate transporter 1-like n=1 Tax=Onthophagus taurus TaxID=166361 RepID=UPI0039BDFA6F